MDKHPGRLHRRPLQVVCAMAAMILISLYEYTFTLFEKPIGRYYHWGEPAVAAIFSVYMVEEAFSMILGGHLADRHGPRWVATAGGLLAGFGWLAASRVHTLAAFYAVYALGSVGPGFVYACAVGSVVKWFPKVGRIRGLAMGLVTGAFGAGSALFIPLISKEIAHAPAGFQHAFATFGLVQLLGIVAVAQLMAFPPPTPTGVREAGEFTPGRMLATGQFWLLWVIFVLVVGAGQMTVAHIAAMGASFKLAAAAVVGVVTLTRIFNGIGRVVIGGLSDYLGRERSMALFFALMALCLYASTLVGGNLALFGLFSVATLFFWGPVFTLVPATLGDYFGSRNASSNYGVMSTGKALGGLYAGLVSGVLFADFGSWVPVMKLNALMVLVGAGLALALRAPRLAAKPRLLETPMSDA